MFMASVVFAVAAGRVQRQGIFRLQGLADDGLWKNRRVHALFASAQALTSWPPVRHAYHPAPLG